LGSKIGGFGGHFRGVLAADLIPSGFFEKFLGKPGASGGSKMAIFGVPEAILGVLWSKWGFWGVFLGSKMEVKKQLFLGSKKGSGRGFRGPGAVSWGVGGGTSLCPDSKSTRES
jgi:hypothetical protein